MFKKLNWIGPFSLDLIQFGEVIKTDYPKNRVESFDMLGLEGKKEMRKKEKKSHILVSLVITLVIKM